jgi:hypothetical protein
LIFLAKNELGYRDARVNEPAVPHPGSDVPQFKFRGSLMELLQTYRELSMAGDDGEAGAAADAQPENRVIQVAEQVIIIVGIGKSGNIGQKISATLTSTGSTSVVLNSVDALHGDLGVVNDGDLIRATLAGRPTSFGQLVVKYQDRLFNALFRVLGSAEDARDITQDAFVQAFLKLETFRGTAAFYTWLYRIGFNLAMTGANRAIAPQRR